MVYVFIILFVCLFLFQLCIFHFLITEINKILLTAQYLMWFRKKACLNLQHIHFYWNAKPLFSSGSIFKFTLLYSYKFHIKHTKWSNYQISYKRVFKRDSLRRSLNSSDSLTRISKSLKLALWPVWKIWSNTALSFWASYFLPSWGRDT